MTRPRPGSDYRSARCHALCAWISVLICARSSLLRRVGQGERTSFQGARAARYLHAPGRAKAIENVLAAMKFGKHARAVAIPILTDARENVRAEASGLAAKTVPDRRLAHLGLELRVGSRPCWHHQFPRRCRAMPGALAGTTG
jgi:hypothetical protein